MRLLPLLVLLIFILSCEPQQERETANFPTPFEQSEGTETATYQELIDFYIGLAREFPEINIQTIGETDSGRPLQLVTYNPDSDFNFQKIGRDKLILLINNGIHPGETDGIDASMLLFRDLALGKISTPENVILAAIPVYNVGGALNRNSTTRVNQNGPQSYGFRGNAKNFDLNRDFIKSDSRNARTFAQIFHTLNPDVFVDTHVSNGADYQYTISYLSTQHHKLGAPLGAYMNDTLMPMLKDSLIQKGWEATPYVNVHGRAPDEGFTQFLDQPRFSTGYTALWGSLGVMIETHMLKPYESRVTATYTFLSALIEILEGEYEKVKQLRRDTHSNFRAKSHYPLAWVVDSTKFTPLAFKGYQADTLPSEISGLPRLKYNRNEPFTKTIPFYNFFRPSDSVEIPEAYIIRKSWSAIMEFMDLNHVAYTTIDRDMTVWAESYKIENYSTLPYPYEGHYLHYDTRVNSHRDSVFVEEGDFIIPTDQPALRYLMETLEPAAVDSFFNWNFFDSILQRKEAFSSYIFEELALKLLQEDDSLRLAFENEKALNPALSSSAEEQLEWIYLRSPYYEEAHLAYPVYRVLKKEVE